MGLDGAALHCIKIHGIRFDLHHDYLHSSTRLLFSKPTLTSTYLALLPLLDMRHLSHLGSAS